MKIKTSELAGIALDWAVAKCEIAQQSVGWPDDAILLGDDTDYSTDWSLGGPIIERERLISDFYSDGNHENGGEWSMTQYDNNGNPFVEELGPTPLIAAMRCYVASKLGEEVDIPEELMK